jgi:hypothetical protein
VAYDFAELQPSLFHAPVGIHDGDLALSAQDSNCTFGGVTGGTQHWEIQFVMSLWEQARLTVKFQPGLHI